MQPRDYVLNHTTIGSILNLCYLQQYRGKETLKYDHENILDWETGWKASLK